LEGYPKYLNTKNDYYYVKNHFIYEQYKNDFQKLLDNRILWLNTGLLENEIDGITDETHKVITMDNMTNPEEIQYYQYEYKEDINCRLFKLGFTVAEVEEILQEVI